MRKGYVTCTVLWLAVILIGVLPGCTRYQRSASGKPLYTARTTLIEVAAHRMDAASAKRRTEDVLALATSQRVLSAAADTLSDLGVKGEVQGILSNTSTRIVKGTNVLSIEVTLDDPGTAKMVADVLAAEVKKAYAGVFGSVAGSAPRKAVSVTELRTIDAAVVFPARR